MAIADRSGAQHPGQQIPRCAGRSGGLTVLVPSRAAAMTSYSAARESTVGA